MPDFLHLAPGDLPSGWEPAFFGDLVEFRLGRTPPRGNKQYWTDGIHPWVTIADMKPFADVNSTKELVSDVAHKNVFKGRYVPPGSLLMSFKLTIGRVSRLSIPAYHNEAIISFMPDPEVVDPDFLFYYLAQIDYDQYQDTAIKGKTLNKEKLARLEIALPPPREQLAIGRLLRAAQDVVDIEAQILKQAEELKSALLASVFTDGLAKEEETQLTDLGPVPAGWTIAPVGDICTLKSGGTPSRAKLSYWDGGTIPWIKTAEVDNGLILATEESITEAGLDGSSARLFPAGTLVMAMYGQGVTRGKVGLLGIEAATNQACVAIMPDEGPSPQFLFYFFQSKYDALREYGHGANQKNLSAEIIKSIPIAYPDEAEQRKIIDLFSEVDARIEVARASKASATELFESMLHGLMSGDVPVRSAGVLAAEAGAGR